MVDALGWRRVLARDGYQPPDAPLSRGLEVHPRGRGDDLEIWIERGMVPAGYGWSFPADDEIRVGLGSFGAHRLRHTAATQMLRSGASLTDVGQVLRHRRVLTTAIYAKVDHDALRALALPWPGSVQ